MAEETLDKHYADRVKEVVNSFVQVWVKFGRLLPCSINNVFTTNLCSHLRITFEVKSGPRFLLLYNLK